MTDKPIIDMCDQGHRFAKLPDHPTWDGRARCPHCMVVGLKALENAERVQDRMMAAVLDFPKAYNGGVIERMLRQAWQRVRLARYGR